MPAIPTHIQQSEARGSLRITPNIGPRGVGEQSLGEGLARVANVLDHVREQDAAADAAVKLAQAQSEWQGHLLERQEQAEPGAPEFTGGLLKDYDDYTEKTLATAKTRNAQNYMRERLAAFRGALSQDALQFESNARITHRKGQFAEAVEVSATTAELDPDRYQERLAEQLAALDILDVPPIEKEALRKGTIDLHQERAAIGYARRDPDAALKRFVEPDEKDTLFRTLSPKARDSVLNEIESQQRMRLTMEDRAYREAERLERDRQDALSKEGDKRLSEGTLTTAWIEQNRDQMSAEDFRYYYRELSGGGGDNPRDVDTYVRLRDRVSRGEDVRNEARQALTRGQIRVQDYDRLVSEVETQRPGWYRRGVDFISISGKPNDLNPEEGAPQRLAAMLDDWSEWADVNPKATDNEARDAYRRIVDEYGLIDARNLSISMRAPRYLVGSRTAPDIDATEQRTVEAYEKGEITADEFERQAELLKQWRTASEKAGTK